MGEPGFGERGVNACTHVGNQLGVILLSQSIIASNAVWHKTIHYTVASIPSYPSNSRIGFARWQSKKRSYLWVQAPTLENNCSSFHSAKRSLLALACGSKHRIMLSQQSWLAVAFPRITKPIGRASVKSSLWMPAHTMGIY